MLVQSYRIWRTHDQTGDPPIARGPTESSGVLASDNSNQTTIQSPQNQVNWLRYLISLAPLVAGALGPVATLMAGSGCLDTWRAVGLPDGSQLKDDDPDWVRIPTSMAIFVGLIANIILLIRLLLGRPNLQRLQYWCITLWVLECIKIDPLIYNDYSGDKSHHHSRLCQKGRRRWGLDICTRILDDSLLRCNFVHVRNSITH